MPSSFVFINSSEPGKKRHQQRLIKSHVSGRYREDVRSSEPTYGLPRVPRRSRKTTGHGRTLYFDAVRTNGEEDRSSPSVEDAGDDLQIMLYSPGFAGTRTDPFLTYPCEVTPAVPTALDHCECKILN